MLLIVTAVPVLFLLVFDIARHFQLGGQDKTILLGRDFINYYSSSALGLQNDLATLFDPAQYQAFQKQYFDAPDLSGHSWSYPPHFLFLTRPLSFFPYLLSLTLWSVLGFFAFYKVSKLYTGNTHDALILALTPAVLICIVSGQNGLLSSCLIAAPFAIKNNHPRIAGILLGLLTYKPQLGVLIPLALILMRDWRVILWAGITTLALLGASVGLFGTEPWSRFIYDVMPYQSFILVEMGPPFSYMVPSVYKSVLLTGGGKNLAIILQLIMSLLLVGLVVWAFLKKCRYDLQLACLFTSILLFSPYLVIYDMPILALSVYLYFRFLKETGQTVSRPKMYFLLFIAGLPLFSFFLTASHLPIAPIFLIGFVVCLVRAIKLDSASSSVAA